MTNRGRDSERALAESETHYRSLFENMLNGFAYCRMIYDSDGRPVDFIYLDVNRAFATMTGLGDVKQRRVSEVIPGIRESDPSLFEIYGRVASTGQPERFETEVAALNMWFSVSVYSPGRDHFVAIFDVITERKQSEMEREGVAEVLRLMSTSNDRRDMMRTMLAYLRLWTGCTAVGIRLRDGDEYPYFESSGFPDRFLRMENHLRIDDEAGDTVRDESGRPILDCMCGRVLQERCDPARPHFTSGGSFWTNSTTQWMATATEEERRQCARQGCNREGFESVALIPLRFGGETFGMVQFNDRRKDRFTPELISVFERLAQNVANFLARQNFEERLRESEEHFREIFENSPIAIWEVDLSPVKERFDELRKSGVTDLPAYLQSDCAELLRLASLVRSVHANRMSAKVLGRELPDDLSRGVTPHLLEESLPVLREVWVALACGSLRRDGEIPFQTTAGERRFFSYSLSVSRGREDSLSRVLVSFSDISERKRAEEAIRLAHDLLEQRVAERTAELKVAYQTLERRAGQLRALASELARAEDRERRRLAQVLHDHLQQLLVAAKFNTATIRRRIEDPDLKAAAQQIVDILDDSILASRNLTMELSPPVLHDAGLPAGLEWLARWMGTQHGLTVEVTAEAPPEPLSEDLRLLLFQAVRELLLNVVKHAETKHAWVDMKTATRGLTITVRDDGTGFDAALTPETPAGFGLFNIRERLTLLEGGMRIESAPGRGATVVLEIPHRRPVPPAASAPAPHSAAHHRHPGTPRHDRHRIRVLVADDHAVVRQGLVQLLRRESGLEIVEEAVDGMEALEKARSLRPDVVLMDVTMPRLTGIEATRRLTAEMPEIRVIGLSVHARDDMAAQMKAAGAVRYLVKDSPIEEIAAAIREAVSAPL